jgi:NDP-sugar pyrophosphorylase family protein
MPNKSKPLASQTRLILDPQRSVARDLFSPQKRPWEAVYSLTHSIRELGKALSYDEYDEISDGIWVHVSAYVSPGAKITAPAIICGGAKLCHFSHVEGSVIGSFATVGENSCVTSSIIFDKATVSSLSSIRSSVIGYKAYIGSHCSLSDLRIDRSKVEFHLPEGIFTTDKLHLGSLVCDMAHVGDGTVISAGSVIGEYAKVSPLSKIEGFVDAYSIY